MKNQTKGFLLEDLEKVRESIKAGYTPRNFTLGEWYGNNKGADLMTMADCDPPKRREDEESQG